MHSSVPNIDTFSILICDVKRFLMEEGIDRDFLASLNPIFRLDSVKIIYSGSVMKVGQRNSLHPRTFVVASPGIFMIRRKLFSFGSRVVRSISFCDLVSLYVSGDCASFSSKEVQIRVKAKDIQKVAFLVYFIRQTQIPTDVLSLNVNLPDDAGSLIQSPYQPESLFMERLLSCAFHYNVMLTNTMLLQVDMPQGKTFTINQQVMDSPLFPSVLLSLTYEQDVTHIKFHDLSLVSLLVQCSLLFRYNRFVRTFTFTRVDFTDAERPLLQMFNKPHGLRPVEWIFVDCDVSKPSFVSFFEAMCSVGKRITTVAFKSCAISEDVFRSIFQAIFFNECFHSLECFVLDDMPLLNVMDNVMEMLCCSWAMQSKCLREIALANCGVDGTDFLKQCFKFDIGLKCIDLSGSELNKPLDPVKDIAVHELSLMKLAGCKNVSLSFFRSLLDLISTHSLSITELDLSMLNLENESDMTTVLELLSETTIPGLEVLAFDDNRMDASQTALFVKFLGRHPDLVSLSVSSSIDVSGSPTGLSAFFSTLSGFNDLMRLRLRSDGSMKHTFGKMLIPFLKGEMVKKLRFLDITNQSIGAEGIDVLCHLVEHSSLEVLYFDGSITNSLKLLTEICEKLLETNLKFASFPAQDFEKSLKILKLDQQEDEIVETRDKLSRAFAAKFESQEQEFGPHKLGQFQRSRSTSCSKPAPVRSRAMVRSDSFGMIPQGLESATDMSPEVAKLYKECVCAEASVPDPIVALISDIQDAISFDGLIATL